MESRWRIELLGGLCVRQGDRSPVRFDSAKTAALLACLALDPGRARSREELAEELWPGEDPEATRSRLRQALAVLRRVLEPPGTTPESVLIAMRRPDVQLDPAAVTTDVAEFQEALRSAGSAPIRGRGSRCSREPWSCTGASCCPAITRSGSARRAGSSRKPILAHRTRSSKSWNGPASIDERSSTPGGPLPPTPCVRSHSKT
jgi:hypothetical protein